MKIVTAITSLFTLVSCVQAQQNEKGDKVLDSLLQQQVLDASIVLSKENYQSLHGITAFRNLIKKFAPTGKISIVSPAEPGKRITVKCSITNEQGAAFPGALVYFYQTSAKGWYADTAAHISGNEGDMRHARLFGYVISDKQGRIEISTIQPAGYPRSDFPGHIHLMISRNEQYLSGYPGELLFEEDERLTPDRKKAAVAAGFLISKNSGTLTEPVYHYKFSLKQQK